MFSYLGVFSLSSSSLYIYNPRLLDSVFKWGHRQSIYISIYFSLSLSMASHSQSQADLAKLTLSTSPKSDGGGATACGRGQCLCSPTTHEGSFRCRFHRTPSSSSTSPWMKRSNSMPVNHNNNNKHHALSISSHSATTAT